MNNYIFTTGEFKSAGALQWAPTRTYHDPNPPINLETPTPGGFYGILKRWTGSAWVKEPLKRYNGATWVDAVLKRWTGSAWGLVDTTGV